MVPVVDRAVPVGTPASRPVVARTAAGEKALRRRRRKVARTRPSAGMVPSSSRVAAVVSADRSGQLVPARAVMGRWARLATTVTVLVVLSAGLMCVMAPAPAAGHVESVTVMSGDTLWSIAATAAPDADPRLEMDRIREINGLSGDALPVGVVLRVPVSGG